MAKKDIFGDDIHDQANDFTSMLEQSQQGALKMPKSGDVFQAEVISVGKEETFFSLNGTYEGMIPTVELLDDQKNVKYQVGETVEVVVTKVRDGDIRLSLKKGQRSSADLESLEDAYDMELPVEGKVLEACKGGYRVLVMGQTAFCPLGQIDLRVSSEPDAYIGRKFDFQITQFEPNKRNVVVSRKRILEALRAESEGEFINRIKPGEILEGKVTRLQPFGAFVALEGGIEGLVHISELSWSRVKDPSEVIQVGASVRVKVLKLDDSEPRLKISLSLKQGGGESDPWFLVEQNYPVGSMHEGVIEKKETYGFFVNIAPGVTGLLPKSKWRDAVEGAQYENKKKGDKIKVRIDQILTQEHKISLGLPTEAEDDSWKSHNGGAAAGFGTLADLLTKAKK